MSAARERTSKRSSEGKCHLLTTNSTVGAGAVDVVLAYCGARAQRAAHSRWSRCARAAEHVYQTKLSVYNDVHGCGEDARTSSQRNSGCGHSF